MTIYNGSCYRCPATYIKGYFTKTLRNTLGNWIPPSLISAFQQGMLSPHPADRLAENILAAEQLLQPRPCVSRLVLSEPCRLTIRSTLSIGGGDDKNRKRASDEHYTDAASVENLAV